MNRGWERRDVGGVSPVWIPEDLPQASRLALLCLA